MRRIPQSREEHLYRTLVTIENRCRDLRIRMFRAQFSYEDVRDLLQWLVRQSSDLESIWRTPPEEQQPCANTPGEIRKS